MMINRALCNYCVYQRSQLTRATPAAGIPLQSSYSGGGNEMTRQRLMNKVAGKGDHLRQDRYNNQAPVVLGKKSVVKSKARDNQQLIASLGGVARPLEVPRWSMR